MVTSMAQVEQKNSQTKDTLKQEQIIEFKADLEQYKYKLSELSLIHQMLELPPFKYEIISTHSKNRKNEFVVYVPNIDDNLTSTEVLVMRAAVEFSDGEYYPYVSLWKDKEKAQLYVSGNYDSEEDQYHGWLGMDFRFGTIDNSLETPNLMVWFSGHDRATIEFGKYSY
ncbi:hypothetical protein V1503_05000 [Bacillus sp. SCS-151]|uniref:hypothetical protein n=1 Tax=Nanhaiella sioensis TaxID=3115293 RepID=UPI0039786BFA